MNIIKKLKFKLSAYKVVLAVVALFGIGGLVFAYTNESSNQPATIIEKAESVVINQAVPPAVEREALEAKMGAGSGPTSPWSYQCINGTVCTYYLTMSFIDASTTIAVFEDPFLTATSSYTPETPLLAGDTNIGQVGATSTIEMAEVNITGISTSTFNLTCQMATGRYDATTTPILITLEDSKITTSTIGVVRSGMTSSTNPGMGSLVLENSSMRTQVMFTPQKPYFVCSVKAVNANNDIGGILGNSNTFDGAVTIKVSKTLY